MKETYKPEDMMTDKEKSSSQEREEAFHAGKQSGYKEMLERKKVHYSDREQAEMIAANEKKYIEQAERTANEIGLTGEMKTLLMNGSLDYDVESGKLWPQDNVTEKQTIEFIEKIKKLDVYDTCHSMNVFSEKIIETVLNKFPGVRFVDLGSLELANKIKSLGGKVD
jgi:hypothetical protein